MAATYFDEKDYGQFIEHDFRYRWLKPSFLYDKLKKFEGHPNLEFEEAGKSIEGRPIYKLKYGTGKIKVVLWTQMHGNEPTATMALIDFLNFITKSDKYYSLRKVLFENLEITMIPMLNPDGAERFTRRNALDVDPNRDAASLAMPELQILTNWVKANKPDWAFNLHDQRNIFTVGETDKSATISFLAASADCEKTLTTTREKSMNLISELAAVVETHLPGHVGKYSDEFYPRALGEYFHKSEIPCILIESGAYAEDEFRDNARKMNFLCLVEGLAKIANNAIPTGAVEKYKAIPENTTNMLDLIIRTCTLNYKGQSLKADIGLLYKELPDTETGQLQRKLYVQDIGDLQFHYAFKNLDGGQINCSESRPEFEKVANFEIKMEDGRVIQLVKGEMG